MEKYFEISLKNKTQSSNCYMEIKILQFFVNIARVDSDFLLDTVDMIGRAKVEYSAKFLRSEKKEKIKMKNNINFNYEKNLKIIKCKSF